MNNHFVAHSDASHIIRSQSLPINELSLCILLGHQCTTCVLCCDSAIIFYIYLYIVIFIRQCERRATTYTFSIAGDSHLRNADDRKVISPIKTINLWPVLTQHFIFYCRIRAFTQSLNSSICAHVHAHTHTHIRIGRAHRTRDMKTFTAATGASAAHQLSHTHTEIRSHSISDILRATAINENLFYIFCVCDV